MAHNKHRRKQAQQRSNTPQKINEQVESGDLDPQLARVIKDLPEEKRDVLLHALSVRQSYSGPLPDGETIKIYSEVIPNGGDRLMKNVEKQMDHRIAAENKGIRRTFNQSSTGQWMGFVIAILFLLAAWDLARQGYEDLAKWIATVDIIGLVAIFVTGRLTNNN